MACPVAVTALVVALVVLLALPVLTIVMCCLWCHTRKELKIIKRRMEYESVVGKRNQQKVNTQLTEYPAEPPPGTHPFEQSLPTPIEPRVQDTSRNYSAVNNLAILPDEVRTPENLEHGQLPADKEKADKLMSDYLRQRQQYEETELIKEERTIKPPPQSSPSKIASTKVEPVIVAPLHATPGYEDIEPVQLTSYQQTDPTTNKQSSPKTRVDDYNNPADYLPPDHPMRDQKAFMTSSSSPQKKKAFTLSTSAEEYTEVFDSLPPGEVGVIGLPKVRAMSDSSRKQVQTSSNGSPSRIDPVHQNGLKNESSSRPGGSLDNVNGFGDRMDSTRQSKRDSAKEFVELDLSKRMFRVTSAKRGTNTAVNKNKDVTDGEQLEESSKKFEVSGDVSNESYAVVNLADKQRYRAESDGMKKEGSGHPRHYGAVEST